MDDEFPTVVLWRELMHVDLRAAVAKKQALQEVREMFARLRLELMLERMCN